MTVRCLQIAYCQPADSQQYKKQVILALVERKNNLHSK
jgi:hypothetical protein